MLNESSQVFAASEIGNKYFGKRINKTVKLTIMYINIRQNKDNVNTTTTINNYRQTNSNNNKRKINNNTKLQVLQQHPFGIM